MKCNTPTSEARRRVNAPLKLAMKRLEKAIFELDQACQILGNVPDPGVSYIHGRVDVARHTTTDTLCGIHGFLGGPYGNRAETLERIRKIGGG